MAKVITPKPKQNLSLSGWKRPIKKLILKGEAISKTIIKTRKKEKY